LNLREVEVEEEKEEEEEEEALHDLELEIPEI
jgi:hypothetical protein